jgi:hypothetical protein
MSSKIFIVQIILSIKNGCFLGLSLTHILYANNCTLFYTASIPSCLPCFETLSCLLHQHVPPSCAKTPKNVNFHCNALKKSFRRHSSHSHPKAIKTTINILIVFDLTKHLSILKYNFKMIEWSLIVATLVNYSWFTWSFFHLSKSYKR